MRLLDYKPKGNILTRSWAHIKTLTIISWRFLAGFTEKVQKKQNITTCNMFSSGIDIVIYLSDKKMSVQKAYKSKRSIIFKPLAVVQDFNYVDNRKNKPNTTNKVTGSFILTMFDRSSIDRFNQNTNIYAFASNEYGIACGMAITDLNIIVAKGGVTVDSLMNEEEFIYTAKNIEHWTPISQEEK
jgi:hypothetical protein